MRRRALPALLALAAAVAAACTGGAETTPSPSPAPETSTASPSPTERALGPFEKVACGMRPKELRRIAQGYHPDRSGQVQIVARRPNFIGAWLSHSGPWDYVQRVPLVLYGPGRVPAGTVVRRPVTLADLSPTLGRYLGFPFDAPDGRAVDDAVLDGTDPPRLIVVVIWDSAGRNVLDEYPDAWPFLRSLADRGTWFENAAVGSSPSVTPASHATIGTGAFPRTHGIVDLRYLVGGELTGARGHGARDLLVPSLADEYDRARDNRPIVGLVGSEGTLGMIGRGTVARGGDRDLAVTRTKTRWELESANAEIFRFPTYAGSFPGLEREVARIDREDGLVDGKWMGESLEGVTEGLSATPAFSAYQGSLLRQVVVREDFGVDDVPDLLFTNFREIDAVGHTWTMNSPQMEAVIRASDDQLRSLVALLNRRVGKGEWVLALTSDHGATPDPDLTGAFVINPSEMQSDLKEAFDGDGDDRPAIVDFRVTQIWVDAEELAEHGHTIKDVARFVANYTTSQNVSDPSALPADEQDDRLFEAAFPGAVLENLPCLDPT